MNTYPNPDAYIDIAEQVDRALTDNFGVLPEAAPVFGQLETSRLYIPFANRVVSAPYSLNSEYGIVDLETNLAILGSNESINQVVGVQRTITVRGQEIEVVNPAILQGCSPDGTGIDVTLLLDPLLRTNPAITDTQDVLLRTFTRLNQAGTGDSEADSRLSTGSSTAAEPGHTYLGLRTVTDPTLIQAIQAGQHPVHDWAQKGIAETVSMRDQRRPGMFDVRMQNGRIRTVAPSRLTLRPGDGTTVLVHPAYKGEARYTVDIPPERLAVAIGIKAAETTVGLSPEQLQGSMFKALDAVNAGS